MCLTVGAPSRCGCEIRGPIVVPQMWNSTLPFSQPGDHQENEETAADSAAPCCKKEKT